VPALAVANELRHSGAEVEFAGGDRVEARMVPAAGYMLHRFATAGFERRLSTGTLRSAWLAGTAPLACRRIIAAVRPDVVFGAGGYVSGPMLLAARAARIPAALLEIDAHMGVANRLAVPLVQKVFLSFPIEGRSGGKYAVTGRPVPAPSPADDPPATASVDVLAFGGSLGATRLNQVVAQAWAGADPGFSVYHITGDREYERYRRQASAWYHVLPFTDNLRTLLDPARLVVARAGGSVFEIAAAGRPSLLVPSPNVTADHQTKNAEHLARAGAAVILSESELTPQRLDAEVRSLLGDPARLEAMGRAAEAWSRPEAASLIAAGLLEMVR
jgi:UDP-N-acetylglucosamine--N-acetylmuramyl-(pentapeptide) pyrophosphoryl-undecaprenol N-acetylglucosamine transferase